MVKDGQALMRKGNYSGGTVASWGPVSTSSAPQSQSSVSSWEDFKISVLRTYEMLTDVKSETHRDQAERHNVQLKRFQFRCEFGFKEAGKQ